MKPCSKNRKLIAWLAMGALNAEPARQLRIHLETCAGCRRYLDEISTVKGNLATVEIAPDLQASAAFHRKWVGAINSVQQASTWEAAVAHLRGNLQNWRVALPALGAIALVILTLAMLMQKPHGPSPAQASVSTVSPPKPKAELSPTLSNYQMAANQSLEVLDELLTRQGTRGLPRVPIYTASTLAAANAVD